MAGSVVVYMRASRYEIFMYASMLGVPALLFFIFLSSYYAMHAVTSALSYILLLGIAVYAITGAKEIYLHRKYPGSMQGIASGRKETGHLLGKAREGIEELTIKIKRFNNDTDRFDESSFKFNADKRTTVLGALLDIKSYRDSTLSVRCNCRMGICGSCGVVVNGKQKLACETNLISSAEDGVVEVGPMLGHPLLKDLVDDFDDFFEKHRSVSPTLERKNLDEKYKAREEYRQSRDEVDKFLPYSYCIMCGLCLDACPVVNTNPNFVGPQALSQAYRYHADSRDQGGRKRLLEIDTADGIWGCEFAGSCSKACPKGVDPASAIQMLKGDIMKNIADKE